MKIGRNAGKKIGMKGRNLPPSSHLQFKHRKIPEKPRGRRRAAHVHRCWKSGVRQIRPNTVPVLLGGAHLGVEAQFCGVSSRPHSTLRSWPG